MHWIRRSVGCRVASASPRLATRHSSPGVTVARFIASVNLRRLTSRRVSGYLPTYLPIHLAIRSAPRRAAPASRRPRRSAPRSPLLSSALFPREQVMRDARSITAEMVSRYALRCNGVSWLFHLRSTNSFTNLKLFPLRSQVFFFVTFFKFGLLKIYKIYSLHYIILEIIFLSQTCGKL